MENLPESIVVEIFRYLRGDQLQRLRGASRAWRKALGAAAGAHIVCNGLLAEEGKQSLSRLLQSYGASTRSITLGNLSQEKVALLTKHCRSATSLVVVFSPRNAQHEVVLVLKLAKGLKGLKQFKLSGIFEPGTMKSLEPIFKRVSLLTLEFLDQPTHGARGKNAILGGLASSSVTTLRLLNLDMDEHGFGELLGGFKNLKALHVIPEPQTENSIAFAYDVKNTRFQEIQLTDNSRMILADIVFRPPHGKGPPPPKKRSKPAKENRHIDKFRALQSYDAYDLLTKYSQKLPPIASIRLEINTDLEGEELDSLNAAIRDFQGVEDLAVEINYDARMGIAMDCADFQAKTVYLRWKSIFTSSVTRWLLHHFPNMQDLYLPKDSPTDLDHVACGDLTFPSLRRVFVHDEQKMGFWAKLVTMAPHLFQINIKWNSPRRELLATKFPHILIGVYAGPNHFQGPLSEPLTGVFNGGRRTHPSNYPDFVPLGKSAEPDAPIDSYSDYSQDQSDDDFYI